MTRTNTSMDPNGYSKSFFHNRYYNPGSPAGMIEADRLVKLGGGAEKFLKSRPSGFRINKNIFNPVQQWKYITTGDDRHITSGFGPGAIHSIRRFVRSF